jgi:hypothetical protein
VKKTMKAHKGKSFKAILRKAKESYTAKGGALSPADYSSSKVGGRKTRKTRKSGRKSRKGGNINCEDWKAQGFASKADCIEASR